MAAIFMAISGISCDAKVKKEKAEVTFSVNLHCAKCVEKVMENISFERGVLDLEINEEAKTVKVVYDAKKTSVEMLQKAFAKLGYEATPVPEVQDAKPVVPADRQPTVIPTDRQGVEESKES